LDPSYVNLNLKHKPRSQRSIDEYVHGLLANQRSIISECITLIESTNIDKRGLATEILSKLPTTASRNTFRIGITGTPGVGKSTFIEAIGLELIKAEHKVAVLAIDPTSVISQGSILGDKTRMETLSNHASAYIRPTPTSNVLGGTAAHTYETVAICEAAQYDRILIETVGVGQSEIEVDNLVDINILLLQPGAGDEMQGIKRGILEKADIIIVHKADGIQLELARKTQNTYGQTLNMFKNNLPNWKCPVILVSSITKDGIADVVTTLDNFQSMSTQSGHFDDKRNIQENIYLRTTAHRMITDLVEKNEAVRQVIDEQVGGTFSIFEKMATVQKKLTNLIQKLS
jgi:LAO/AO transport system kinase